MDLRFAPTPQDSKRTVALYLFAADVTIPEAAANVAHDLDLTPFVSSLTHRPAELAFGLAWHRELYGAPQPKPGQVVSLLLDNVVAFVGVIEALSDYRLSTGTRTMSVTCRSRDASPMWREVPRISDEYEQGTQLGVIARDIAAEMGLTPTEILLPAMSSGTHQSSTQFAGIAAWNMLESLCFPSGHVPFLDGLGRLRAYSRDITRVSDQVLEEARVIAVTGSRSRSAITRLKLLWQDPNLTKVSQQGKVLAQANITAGFFQLWQTQELYWSDDRRQRAQDTYLVVKQSANSGLFPVCSESYTPIESGGVPGEFGGTIKLHTLAYVPSLLLAMLAAKAASFLPDGVSGSVTVPYGRKVQAAIEFGTFVTMASMGTGSYEIWGTPYDYVHGRNTTEAYDIAAPSWVEKVESIECDFILTEEHAQATVGREFLYRARSSSSYGVTLVDDPRIEIGDILELPDSSRIYVTDYSRNLSPGAPAILEVQGFQVGTPGFKQ